MEEQKNRGRREVGAVPDEWMTAAARVTEELCLIHPLMERSLA